VQIFITLLLVLTLFVGVYLKARQFVGPELITTNPLVKLADDATIAGVSWGTCYLYIRRGMNVKTKKDFFSKFWRDGVYGGAAASATVVVKFAIKKAVGFAESEGM